MPSANTLVRWVNENAFAFIVIAVGMPVTRHPRTDPCGRFLAHTVLTLDIWIFSANSLQRIRVQDGRSREVLAHPSVQHRTADGALPSPPHGQPPMSDHIVPKRLQPGKIPRYGVIVEVALHYGS